jgi:hypothetical protein
LTDIRTVLFDPDVGLFPYLEQVLEQNFHRYQIRRWFPGNDPENETAGFRLRDGTTKNESDDLKISSIVTIGKVLTVTDQVESQLVGEEIRVCIDQAIVEWSRCVGRYVDEVLEITGAPYIEQDPNQDSGNEGAWSIYVIREFTLTYDRGKHEGFPNYEVANYG